MLANLNNLKYMPQDNHSSTSSSQLILYFCLLCLSFIMLLRVEQFWCLFTAECHMKLLHGVFLCVCFKFLNLKIELMKYDLYVY